MNDSYENILERMSSKFRELSGYDADRVSDVGVRMRVLAGEIFSLTSQLDHIKNQMFALTASGESLDRHAQQAGIQRQKGNKAQGRIMFRLDMPLEFAVTIPAGTLCTTSDGTLNYITKEELIIERGSSFAYARCEAENSGSQYNISSRQVTTIVTYFSVGIGITNATSFTGGTDDENDDPLRKRLIEHIRNKPNGLNRSYYTSLAVSVDGVYSASVTNNPTQRNALILYIAGKGARASDEAYLNVQNMINANKSFGVSASIYHATLDTVNVSVRISTSGSQLFADVSPKVVAAVTAYFERLLVGEKVTAASLGNVIYDVDGVDNYQLVQFEDHITALGHLAVLGTVSVDMIPTEG